MTNPVDAFLKEKNAQPGARREKEQKLWETWRAHGQEPAHLEPLLKAFDPVVNAKIREWKAPGVNESAFRAELHTHMIHAFVSFDPARGASLRTHVEGRIRKAMRYNVKNQNFAYIPEEPARYIGRIQRAQDELREEHGREPTHEEVARAVNLNDPKAKAKLTAKKVKEIITFQRADRPGSQWTFDPVAKASNRENEVLALIQAELPSVFPKEEERQVFEHIYGMNGRAKIEGTNELAKKLGKSPSQIARIKSASGTTVKGFL